MALDTFLVGFAFSAGAASFFSPCSVGLFPAYIAYFLASDPHAGGDAGRGEGPAAPSASLWDRALEGIRLGGLAASGFFLLFLGIGLVVVQAGAGILGTSLRGIAIGVGLAIIALGVLLFVGKFPTLHPRLRGPTSRTPASVFAFGIGYGLASLGCTLPVFLGAALAGLVAGGAPGAFIVLVSYAAGMGVVMIGVTVALAASGEAIRARVRRLVPVIQRASAAVVVFAGSVVVYYYAVVWR